MNICTILNTNQSQSSVGFLGGNLAKFSYTNTCNKMHFISFEGEWKKSQVEMTTLKVRKQTLISFI